VDNPGTYRLEIDIGLAYAPPALPLNHPQNTYPVGKNRISARYPQDGISHALYLLVTWQPAIKIIHALAKFYLQNQYFLAALHN
jgi:hypothetical protein